MRYNVKSFIEVYGNKIFDRGLIKSIKLETNFQYERKSYPTIFGTAYNIIFDYELFRRSLIGSYEPKRYKEMPLNKELSDLLKKIDQKEILSGKELLLLVREENLYRNGNLALYSQGINENEIKAMKEDLEFMYSSVDNFLKNLKPSDKIIGNPYFVYDDYVKFIYGDGDFILNDILFEIKCVSDEGISPKTQKQLIMYKILNDNALNGRNYKIDKFGYFNPLKNQIYIWDCDIAESIQKSFMNLINSVQSF